MIHIRPERSEDRAAVRSVNELAFGRAAEADLVEALGAAQAVVLALVAERESDVIGYIAFSEVVVSGPAGDSKVLGLGPMAVLPGEQRRGFGGRLIRSALGALRADGHAGVVVVGHPTYYPRFGFVPASWFGISWEVSVPDEVFMAIELVPGALRGGIARYRPEFNTV